MENPNIADRDVEITEADFKWIAERCNTAPSGTVAFTPAAIKRFRKLTKQEHEPAWKIRHQMQNMFGNYI